MKRLLVCATLLLSSTAFADGFCVFPYVGIEGKLRFQGFSSEEGAKSKTSKMPEGGLIAGLKFNDYFGLELGATVGKGTADKETGSTSHIRSGSIMAMGFVPVGGIVEVLGGVGISHFQNILKSKANEEYFRFDVTKALLKGIVGVQFKLTDNFKLRTSVSMENTKKLSVVTEDVVIPYKNHYCGHLGLLYSF